MKVRRIKMAKNNVNIEVTDVRVYPVESDSTLCANVSITINEVLVIWCKLIESKKGYFLSFPSHSYKSGKETVYKDDVFFLDGTVRESVTDIVVDAYVADADLEDETPKQRPSTRKRK